MAKRIVGEGLAIFAGVLLALAADDWRETRSEEREAEGSLALVLSDLQRDSAELTSGARVGRRLALTSSWLAQNWDRPKHDRDSLEIALYQYSRTSNLQLSRAGFEGLQNANRLRLIANDSLRNSLLQYYQVRQSHVEDYYTATGEAIMRLFAAMAPHVRRLEGDTLGSMWPPREARVLLRHDWAEIAADPMLYEEIVWVGRFGEHLGNLMTSAQDEATALMHSIRDGLGRD